MIPLAIVTRPSVQLGLFLIPFQLLFGGLSLSAQTWTNALQGWWSGDRTTRNLVGTNVALFGIMPAYSPAVFQMGFHLNGTNFLQVPDAPTQRPPRVTVAAWVQFVDMDTRGAATPGLQYIVFKRRPEGRGFEGYTLVKDRLTGTDRLKFVVASGSGEQNQVVVTSSTVVVPGRFYFVVGTHDGQNARLFVDGALEATQPAPFHLDYARTPLCFGSSRQSYDGRLSGILDEVMIFDRALDADEIRSIWEERNAEPSLQISGSTGVPVSSWSAVGASLLLEYREQLDVGRWEPLTALAPRRERFRWEVADDRGRPQGFYRLGTPE